MVPWERFGVGADVDHGDGKHDAYRVGPREAADAEAKRIRSGGPVRSPADVIRLLQE